MFAATFVGYSVGNTWFYALGALLVLNAVAAPSAQGIGVAIFGFAGGMAGSCPRADRRRGAQRFANIYSTAVSTLNMVPRASAAMISIVVGGIAFLIALLFTMDRYEVFLFLIGSVFVPLGAVFLADYFVRARGRYGPELVFGPGSEGVRWSGGRAVGGGIHPVPLERAHWSGRVGGGRRTDVHECRLAVPAAGFATRCEPAELRTGVRDVSW